MKTRGLNQNHLCCYWCSPGFCFRTSFVYYLSFTNWHHL